MDQPASIGEATVRTRDGQTFTGRSLMSLETPTAAGTEARTPAWIARRPAVAKDIIWGIVDHPDPEAVRAAYLAQLAHDRDAVARRLRELRATHGWGDARTTGPEVELSSLRAEIRRFS